MKCTHFKQLIIEHMEGSTTPIQQQAIERHLLNCEQCSRNLEQDQKLVTQLRNIPVPAASHDFEERVMNSLQTHKPAHKTNPWFIGGLGTALAAGVMLWFVSTFDMFTTSSPHFELVSVELAPNQVQKVSLVFSSPQELNDATFKIELPEHLKLKGYKGKKLQWKTRLKKGVNRLTLPLVSSSYSDQFINARIEHNNQIREFKIRVQTKVNRTFNKNNMIRLTT